MPGMRNLWANMTEPFPLNSQFLISLNDTPMPCTAQRFSPNQISQNSDLLYAITSLYKHILPNVPFDEIEKDILCENTYTFAVFRADSAVQSDFAANKSRILRKFEHQRANYSDFSEDDAENLPEDLLKCQEFISVKGTKFEKYVHNKYPLLLKQKSLDLDPRTYAPRLKDKILAAATVKIRVLQDNLLHNIKVAQLTYLGVRTRFELLAIGRKLLQNAIEAATDENEDAFFTFAGSDSVRFYRNAGLSDDPLQAGFFTQLDEAWTDVVPMVKYLQHEGVCEDENELYGKWRSQAYQRYQNECVLIQELIGQIKQYKAEINQNREEREKLIEEAALEKSRCVMYEQLVQQLENQLLSIGVKPNIDEEQVMSKVLGKMELK